MIHKKAAALPALCFMAALLAITALDLLRPDRAFSAELKCPLAQRPTLSWQGLQNGSYTQAYQTYLDDQFIARPLLVEVSGRSQYLLGSRELKGVYLGRRQTLLPVPAAFSPEHRALPLQSEMSPLSKHPLSLPRSHALSLAVR